MKYIFSCMGGSGSTYIIKTLSKIYDVGNKPDTVFRPLIDELKIGKINNNQGSFFQRSNGFKINDGEKLQDILPKYISYLNESDKRTAVFNTCAELGLFSSLGIENVIFIVRHPLHSYVSWAKPERHGGVIKYLGGINSKNAVLFWANRWNKFTDEIFRLHCNGKLGGLIRFEYAKIDVEKFDELRWVFKNFDTSKRNNNVLKNQYEELLKRKVCRNFKRLYPDWYV